MNVPTTFPTGSQTKFMTGVPAEFRAGFPTRFANRVRNRVQQGWNRVEKGPDALIPLRFWSEGLGIISMSKFSFQI